MKIFENIDCMIGMEKYKDILLSRKTLAIVDPPYGININTSGRLVKEYGWDYKDWDMSIPDDTYFNKLFNLSNNQIIYGGNYFKLPTTKCYVIWDKQQPEDLSFAMCEYLWASFKSTAQIFRYRTSGDNRIHPTQKPIALYKWLLEKYGKGHDLILDTHVGSASSLIACEEMGFDYIGFELDKDYYEAATKRIENYRKQEKLFKPEKKEIIQEKLAV